METSEKWIAHEPLREPAGASRMACLLLYTFWLLLFAPCASGAKLLIVKQRNNPVHNQIVATINQSITPDSAIALAVREVAEPLPGDMDMAPDLVVTLGHTAAQKLSPHDCTAVLYALLPENIADERLQSHELRGDRRAYALYLDQPMNRQLGLLQLLLPRASKVGILTGPFSAHKLEELQDLAQSRQIKLIRTIIDSEKRLGSELANLLPRVDALLALPDPLVHNVRSVPHLLLTTYRYSVPVIGFSEAYVKAGAIAAVYSTTEQIARQISEFIADFFSSEKPLPTAGFHPKYFSVATNPSVARSMGLSLPPRAELEAELQQSENSSTPQTPSRHPQLGR